MIAALISAKIAIIELIMMTSASIVEENHHNDHSY